MAERRKRPSTSTARRHIFSSLNNASSQCSGIAEHVTESKTRFGGKRNKEEEKEGPMKSPNLDGGKTQPIRVLAD